MAQPSELVSMPTGNNAPEIESAEEVMEVDDVCAQEDVLKDSANISDDLEDGEIDDVECGETNDAGDRPLQGIHTSRNKGPGRVYENTFKTGIDLGSEEGKMLLEKRAKRFGLDGDDVKIPDVVPANAITESVLQELYRSLSMTEMESSYDKQGYRLNAIHIRGVQEMNTDDVFSFFRHYSPASLEWINDVSCNVVWPDKINAARALIGLSKPIIGLTERRSDKYEEIIVVEEDINEGETIEETMEEVADEKETNDQENRAPEHMDLIPASSIDVPIPPGYWRYGGKKRNSKGLLLRFARVGDKKPPGAESHSEYYRVHGNPNYGGMKGFISQNRKRKRQERKSSLPKRVENTSKNPWGNLAQDWSAVDIRPKEPRDRSGLVDPVLLEKIEDVRMILKSNRSNPPAPPPTIHSSDSELLSESSSEEEMHWTKKLKRPQMRMHADEEEKKINKRRKMAARSVKVPHRTRTQIAEKPKLEDLRSRLSQSNQGSVWSRLQAPARSERRREYSPKRRVSEEEDEDEPPVRHSVQSTISAVKGDLRGAIEVRKSGGKDLRSKIVRPEPKRESLREPRRESRRRRSVTPPYKKEEIRIEIKNERYKEKNRRSSGSDGESSSSSSSSGSSSSSSSSSSSGSSSSSDSESEDESKNRK